MLLTVIYLFSILATIIFMAIRIDSIITAINRINHNATVFLLFVLGVCSGFIGFLLIAHYPSVDHDIGKAMAGLGTLIIGGAMMAFRGGADSTSTASGPQGTTTHQASVSGDPQAPKA